MEPSGWGATRVGCSREIDAARYVKRGSRERDEDEWIAVLKCESIIMIAEEHIYDSEDC